MQKFYLFRKCTNFILRQIAGGKQRPVFFDIDATCPQLSELNKNFAVIQSELVPLLEQRDAIPHYHELDPTPINMAGDNSRRWNLFVLLVKGQDFEQNRAQCPKTCEILEQIPGVFQSFVSILEAGKSVPTHSGSNLGYLRYHLGIKAPAVNPPTLHFADRHHTWQEGQSILFDDTWKHNVTNESTEDRVVLIVDIIRPYPWYGNFLNKVFMHVYGKIYGERIARKVENLQQKADDKTVKSNQQ